MECELNKNRSVVEKYVRVCACVVKRWPHSPSFRLPFVCTPSPQHTLWWTRRRVHVCIAHSQLPTHQESDGDRPCWLTQKLLILLSSAMNDLPRPISEFRNEFNTNNDSGRIL